MIINIEKAHISTNVNNMFENNCYVKINKTPVAISGPCVVKGKDTNALQSEIINFCLLN